MRAGPAIAILMAVLGAAFVASQGAGQQDRQPENGRGLTASAPPPARPQMAAPPAPASPEEIAAIIAAARAQVGVTTAFVASQGAGQNDRQPERGRGLTASAPPPARPQMAAPPAPASPEETAAIIAAARAQVGVTTAYDPAYARLDYPGGDVPRDRGVCTDVLIRALRDGAHIDLQLAINRDMKASFAAYPGIWGLKRPDPNIDHRRVPNLATLLTRLGAARTLSTDPADFQPGDIVTSVLPGNLPHIMLISDRRNADGTPLVIHNIGRGTREEDALSAYPQTGHYRIEGPALAELRRLGQLEY